MVVAAAPSPYWFVTRATGVVALILLTCSVALGVAGVRRMQLANLRFVVDALHRSVSLTAVAFVALHVLTALLDGFAPISVLDVFIPFHSAYRPVWLGLGAVSFDLAAAVTVTSLLRDRLGYRAWRVTHWLAYLSWPLALIHSYGTGTDPKTHWMLVLTTLCVAAVLAAVVARVSAGWPGHLPMRLSALGVAALFPLGLVAWLLPGPLASRRARRRRCWHRRVPRRPRHLAQGHGLTPARPPIHLRYRRGSTVGCDRTSSGRGPRSSTSRLSSATHACASFTSASRVRPSPAAAST
jgi:methionine sulfoxide reductase heme-binding subunit